jgi:hypothetical protein
MWRGGLPLEPWACGFGELLFKIPTSAQVRGLVVDIVCRALKLLFLRYRPGRIS